MNKQYLTPVYSSLYKEMNTLGVSPKFFTIELAIAGIIAFVIKTYILLPIIPIAHIFVAILNKKEKEWREIYKFIIRIPDEKHAKLD